MARSLIALPRPDVHLDYAFAPPKAEDRPMPNRSRSTLNRSRAAWVAAFACLLVGIGAVCITAPPALGAPQPDPIPRRWELRVEMGPLRVAYVDVENVGPMPFYYLTFKATNNSGQDLFLSPLFELATDDGDVIRSSRDVPRSVYTALLARIQNPFLVDEIDVQGMIGQGDDQAKEGLVVWPATDLTVDEVSVYAAGFSGETQTVVRPDNGQTVLLRKTLMDRHAVPGEIDPALNPTLDRTEERWILR